MGIFNDCVYQTAMVDTNDFKDRMEATIATIDADTQWRAWMELEYYFDIVSTRGYPEVSGLAA
jgi:hypothetical protein